MFFRHVGLAALALLSTTALAWAAPVAQVVKLSGDVELTRGTDTVKLALGNTLEPGDKLTTDGSSRVRVQLIDGSTINIGSGSEFSIDDVVSKGPGTERQVGLDLWLGVILTHAEPATPKSRFEIRTPKAITAVRGTEWGIYAFPTKSDVVVISGSVGVRHNIVSGDSAISLTRSAGVTVTDEGLGQITRWSKEQIAALVAATDVPGPEMGFDLTRAPAINLATPAPIVTPEATPEPAPQGTKKPDKNCLDPSGNNCRKNDKGGNGNGGGGRHDSSGGSGGSGY